MLGPAQQRQLTGSANRARCDCGQNLQDARGTAICCLMLLWTVILLGCSTANAVQVGEVDPQQDSVRATADDQHATGNQSDGLPEEAIDLAEIAKRVSEQGVEPVIESLRTAESGTSRKRLAWALDSIRDLLKQHPDQFWFQLQARTRLAHLEDIQQQLLDQMPKGTLIAKSSLLRGPVPEVAETLRTDLGAIVHLRVSSDRRELYCSGFASRLAIVRAESLQLIRNMATPGQPLATTVGAGSEDYVITRRGQGMDGPVFVQNIRTGETIAQLKDKFPSESDFYGYPRRPPLQTARTGMHLVFWNGSSFVDRELANTKNVVRFRSKEHRSTAPLAIALRGQDRLVSFDKTGSLRVFDYPAGREAFVATRIIDMPEGVAFSDDGIWLAASGTVSADAADQLRSGSSGQQSSRVIVVWNLDQQKEVARFSVESGSHNPHYALAFVDGETLLSGDRHGRIHAWSISSRQRISTVNANPAAITSLVPAPIPGFAFSGDISGILTLVDYRSSTEVLPAAPFRPFRELHSFDGQWEGEASNNTVRLWSVKSNELLHEFKLPDSVANDVGAPSSTGINLEAGSIVIAGSDRIKRWNFNTGEVHPVLLDRTRERATKSLVSPDGRYIAVWDRAVSSAGPLNCYRVESGKAVLRDLQHWTTIAHDDRSFRFISGERLVVMSDAVRVYDLTTGTLAAEFSPAPSTAVHDFACATRSGITLTTLAVRNLNGEKPDKLAIWKPGEAGRLFDFPNAAKQNLTAVDPDGRRAITASHDGILLLWDVTSGVIRRQFDLGVKIKRMDFDGTILIVTASDDQQHVFQYAD